MASWSPGSARVDLSVASVSCSSVRPTTTMASSASAAAAVADASTSDAGAGTGETTSPFMPMPEAMTCESVLSLPSGPGCGSERTTVSVAVTRAPSRAPSSSTVVVASVSMVQTGGRSIDSPGSNPSATSSASPTRSPSRSTVHVPLPSTPRRTGPEPVRRAVSTTCSVGRGSTSSHPVTTEETLLCSLAMTTPSASR